MNSAKLKAYGQILFAPATGSVLVLHLQIHNTIRLMQYAIQCLTGIERAWNQAEKIFWDSIITYFFI